MPEYRVTFRQKYTNNHWKEDVEASSGISAVARAAYLGSLSDSFVIDEDTQIKLEVLTEVEPF